MNAFRRVLPSIELTEDDRAELAARRAEYWSWVGRVGTGVFLGMCAFAVVLYFVVYVWAETKF